MYVYLSIEKVIIVVSEFVMSATCPGIHTAEG